MKRVVSIAGSDPSGGAGVQADIKVLSGAGVYAAGAVTALTRQTTEGVLEVKVLPPDWVKRQVEDVLWDLRPHGIKTGMLGNAATALAVAETLEKWLATCSGDAVIVVDPVLASGGGFSLYEAEGTSVLKNKLFPLATLVTPNAMEAGTLTGIKVKTPDDAKEAAAVIKEWGCRWVLVKGGHLENNNPGMVTDLLYDGNRFFTFSAPRTNAGPLHGTGCCLASLLTARLVHGDSVPEAVKTSTGWLRQRIAGAIQVGRGRKIVCQAF